MTDLNKKVVIFVSSVYEESRNGPAIYAQYLNNHFANEQQSHDFIFVGANPNLKKLQFGLITYFDISLRAKKICKHYRKKGYIVICHYNIPSNFIIKNPYASYIITQANDTRQAELFEKFFRNIRHHGIRRTFSFLIRKLIEIKAFKASDLVVVNSDYTLKTLKRIYGDKHSFLRIYKGVNLQTFGSNNSNQSNLANKIYMISVGSDWKSKNFLFLMDVVDQINSKYGRVVISLTIVGVNDKNFAERCKKFNFVNNIGPLQRDDLVKLMKKHDLYVLATKDEALGVSLLEASALGLFVMGSNAGGIPEIIDDNKSGILFDPNNTESLFLAVERYMRLTSEERTVLINNSKKKVQDFSETIMLKNICELYEKKFSLL